MLWARGKQRTTVLYLRGIRYAASCSAQWKRSVYVIVMATVLTPCLWISAGICSVQNDYLWKEFECYFLNTGDPAPFWFSLLKINVQQLLPVRKVFQFRDEMWYWPGGFQSDFSSNKTQGLDTC